MTANKEKVLTVWVDDVKKIISTKEIKNAKPVQYKSATELSKLISNGYKIG